MRRPILWLLLAISSLGALVPLPLVDSTLLQTSVTKEALLQHANNIQDIAYSSPGRNRYTGSIGYIKTAEYIVQQLNSTIGLKNFYNVTVQPWTMNLYHANGSLKASTPTNNVLAESWGGDPDKITLFGAHSDSVASSPGLNDNGSGIIGLIEVAKQLSAFRVSNKIRFAWWSGEEQGLLGSRHYISILSTAEKEKIKGYLNFDMIASPNFRYGILADLNLNNTKLPVAALESSKIAAVFAEFYRSQGLHFQYTAFAGNSDYAPFLSAGIPVGGIDTGGSHNKTSKEVEIFGGVIGAPYDDNYHRPGDTVNNINTTALLVNTRAIAHAVAVFGRGEDALARYD